MNIELIQGTLEVSESPGMETTDPRFSDMATLVQEGKYEEAAILAEAVLAEKIYDIRIIGYFFYGHFIERGVAALAGIYLSLSDLLGENLEALGPVRNREKHLQTSLNWLTKQIFRTLQYEEEKKGDLYEQWVSEVTSDEVQEALDAAEKLRRVLGPVLEEAAVPILEGLTKTNDWLKAFQRLIYREPEPQPLQESEDESVEEGAGESDEAGQSGEGQRRPEKVKRIHPPSFSREEETPGVEGSHLLKVLLRKLEAFEYLIAVRKYASAAMIGDDLKAIIADFDPRLYFPNLFSRFILQSVEHFGALAVYDDYKDSPAWHALQELYKVDLESFVDFDPEVLEFSAYGSGLGSGTGEGHEGVEEAYSEESAAEEGYDADSW